MKLATVNLYAKEVFSSCTTNFPTVGNMPPELTNLSPYLHFNPIQQVISGCGVEIGINSSNMALRRMISIPLTGSLIEAATDDGGSNDQRSEVWG
ncbi:hypothetical protein V6N13_014918 [Hibiscus sabdariffa]